MEQGGGRAPPALLVPLEAPAALPLHRPIVVDARSLLNVLVLGLVMLVLWQLREVLVTLLFAVVLTFAGAPVVARLEARGLPRAAGAALFLLSAVLALGLLLSLILPSLISQMLDVFQKLPQAFQHLVKWFEATTGQQVPMTVAELSGKVSQELVDEVTALAKSGSAIMGKGAAGVVSGAMSALGFVARAVLVPVIAFFLLVELAPAQSFVMRFLPVGARTIVRRYAPLVDNALSGLVRGQLIVAGIMAAIYVVGLLISGVPLALAIGILAGVAYLVPFASSAVCFSLAVLFSLLQLKGEAGFPIAGALVTCVVVQVVEGWVLTPRIVGENAGLSPLAAVLAVLVGGSLLGFLGVLFALPVAAVIGVVVREEMRRTPAFVVEGA